MAESESEQSDRVKKVCKYCKKNMTNGLICKKCSAAYHNSCAIRVKTCCEQLIQEVSTAEQSNNPQNTVEQYLREENILLKQIIKDKDTIINDKEFIISLLNHKLSSLEENLKSIPEKKSQNMNKNTQLKNTNHKTDNTVSVTTKQKLNDKTLPRKHTNLEILQSNQENIMKELINLNDNNDNPSKTAIGNSEQGKEEPFQPVISRRKRARDQKVCGEAEISKDDEVSGFVGRELPEKKIWLFVARVKDHVTEDMVQNYIQKKTEAESTSNIYVKEIDTFNKTKDNRCFKVGLKYDLLEVAYTNTFWPRGVVVYRFNFKKEEKYLNRLRNKDQEVGNFPTMSQDQDFT